MHKKKKDGRQGKRKVKNSQSHFDFDDIEIYISRLVQYLSLILVNLLIVCSEILPVKTRIIYTRINR